MKAYALTDTGRVRRMNQDSVYASTEAVGPLPNLFVVADGMGGHQAGDYASRFLVERLPEYIRKTQERQTITILERSVKEVNSRLYHQSLNDEKLHGMGTTLVAAVVDQTTLYVANVGDSRLYLVRDGIKQVTRDHSYVEELVMLGQIKRDSEDYRNQKNIITRAVGTGEDVEIDFFELNLEHRDLLLLCSDGVTNMVEDSQIGQILSSGDSLEEKTERLILLANENGGRDNISVILIDPQVSEV